jgi:hypothetical protein
MNVEVANGELLPCCSEVKDFEWWCQGQTFQVTAKVIDMGAYDLVLGMDWLEQYRPMVCDWLQKWIEFRHNNAIVRLQSIISDPHLAELREVSAEQVFKWESGNDLWLAVLIEPADKSHTLDDQYLQNGIHPKIKSLIQEFDNLFREPSALPPSRQYDHAITLLPNAPPVNSRPYRYSPEQKNEIERQMSNILNAGTIIPSLSPFASPVLLVKKKDNSWRFCVDYRKLNNITVKNKFLMPVIDEFLDEIAGARYFSTIDLASSFHQIRMLPADDAKIAFKTHHGHFQFRVMPFGLTNAPTTFQCLMNAIFGPYMRKFVLIFILSTLVWYFKSCWITNYL